MRDHVGEEFEGTVTGVTAFGLFVTLDDFYVDGLVHISELGQDYFHFDASRHQLLGERTRKRYRLADRVQGEAGARGPGDEPRSISCSPETGERSAPRQDPAPALEKVERSS